MTEILVLNAEIGVGPDEVGESLGEESRPDEAGHAVDAADGALQPALFPTADAAGHERLVRGTGEAPEGHHGNGVDIRYKG